MGSCGRGRARLGSGRGYGAEGWHRFGVAVVGCGLHGLLFLVWSGLR